MGYGYGFRPGFNFQVLSCCATRQTPTDNDCIIIIIIINYFCSSVVSVILVVLNGWTVVPRWIILMFMIVFVVG